MANTPLLRTLFLPPLFALALYLTLTYLLLPLYRRHRERASYSLLPTSLSSSSSPSSSVLSTITSAIGNAILRAAGTSRSALYREGGHGGGGWSGGGGSEDEEFGIGDEELEEGVVLTGPRGEDTGRGGGRELQNGAPAGRRLSRDLEGGFMDDSDEEEEEEEGQGGRRMGR